MQSKTTYVNQKKPLSSLQSVKDKKIIAIALIVLSFLNIIFFLTLFLSVRCEPDDMIIGIQYREEGFLKTVMARYYEVLIRPTYMLFSFVTLSHKNLNVLSTSVFLYYFFLFLVFVFAAYKIIAGVFNIQKLNLLGKILLVNFSIVQISCIYFLCSDRIEVFGWISGSMIHLAPVIFILLSAWLLFKNTHKKTDYIFLFICSFLVAGGAEHIAFLAITCFGFVLVRLLYRNKFLRIELNRNIVKKLIFFITFITLFLAFFVTAPGVLIRYGLTRDFVQSERMEGFGNPANMFLQPYKLIGLLLVFSSWIFFLKLFPIKKLPALRTHIAVIGIFSGIIIILTGIFIYHSLEMGRLWLAFDVFVYLLLSAIAIYAIQKIDIKRWIVFSLTILTIGTIFWHNLRHVPRLTQFSEEYDKAVWVLRSNNKGEVIDIEKFPDPDLTTQVELSQDPDNAENQLFCRFYNIPAKVSIAPKKK